MWDGFLTALAIALESVTWWYAPTVILLWSWHRWNPSSQVNVIRVLFATNTLLLIHSVVWSITFLIAWIWPIANALADGREASAYLPHNGAQFVLTSFISFLIGLVPVVFLRRPVRTRFVVSFVIIVIGWIWKLILDVIERGHIRFMPGINVETMVLYLFVFSGLLYLTFRIVRKGYDGYLTHTKQPAP